MCEPGITVATMPTPPPHPDSPSLSTPTTRSQFHQTSPEITARYTPEVVKRMQVSECFQCKQIGHWSWHCPLPTPNSSNNNSSSSNKRFSPSPNIESPLNPPKIFCRCGHGFCVVKTSRTEKNPGRKFYVCPIKRGKPCKQFVGWCDLPVDESYMQPPPYKYPDCECGAGVCEKVKDPDDANKYCFVCPVRKEHGSCGHKVSEDKLLDSNKSIDPVQQSSQKHDDLGEGGDLHAEHSKRMRMMDGFETPLSTAVPVSELLEGGNGTPEATPPRRVSFPEFEIADDFQEVVNSETWDVVEREALLSRRSTPPRDSCRQNLFPNNSLAGAFTEASLGIFPSFDLIAVPKQETTCDDNSKINQQLAITNVSEHAQLSSNGCHTEVSRDVLGHTEVSLSRDVSVSPPSQSQGSKRKPLSKAERERQAALVLQQALLNDLEDLDTHDKESMRAAAEDTFVVLDRLSVDYKQFSEHVWDFINHVSAVADIDESMENSLTLEECNRRIEEERVRLARIQEDCVKTEALLDASNQRRQSLREEVSRLEAVLHERRNQLSSCELESSKIETRLGDLKGKMIEAGTTLKGRTEEAELARRLSEGRQREQMAADAAMEKAKLVCIN